MDVVDTAQPHSSLGRKEEGGWRKVFHSDSFFSRFSFLSDPASQFSHRKVTVKRSRDVRSNYDMKEEIGR